MKNKTNCKIQTISFLFLTAALLLLSSQTVRAGEDDWTKLGADDNFGAWHQTGDWYVASDAMVDPENNKRLAGKPGTGVLINGKTGRTRSLVTKRNDFRDVELHLEFMVAKGSNSGVIFHGLYEIQIHDSHGVKQHDAGHCGGIYPRAEMKPKYHRIDKGFPARVNAAKPPGEWQTLDIIFQSPRFDKEGKKTAHARFVKVTHNGQVIHENQEVEYATGGNWRAKQVPQGPIIFQGDYGPVALRNVRVRPWKAGAGKLNVPPDGFTALFNGKDFTGWRLSPKARKMWSVEDGVLKSHGLLKEWGADLATEKKYQDFVLMVDFRMPTISDSGINFRGLIPEMGNFGQTEQFNLRSKGGMGHLESFYFMPENIKKSMGLKEEDLPHVRYIDPEVSLWHTVKLTLIGKTLTAEYDGEIILDRFEYPEGILSMEPAIIRFQKHVFVNGDNLGEMNPCPIEYRNIFIKEIKSSKLNVPPKGFTALFNGKDFTGWKARQRGVDSEAERAKWQQNWKVEAGIIKFDGKGPTLWTAKKFKDFVLMVDWRFPKPGDSGIYLRGRSKSQVNIWCHEMGSGEVWGYRTDKKLPDEIRKACTPLKKMDKPVGQWNRFVITMKGDRLTVKLNGEVVIKSAQLPGVPAEGEIALQRHGNPIEFKNIYVKSLESAPKPTDDPPAGTDDRVQAVIDELEKSCIKREIRLLAPEKAQRLAELLRQVKPRAVVECGTAVGYASLWIARELKAAGRGKLTTIEIVPNLAREAEANIQKAGLADYVTVRVGDARKLVKELKGPIDFVLLDCLPPNYHACFIGLEDKLEDGAIVVADNAGYGARGMANYLKHVRAKYKSTTEWFDIDLPWAKRDAIEVTVVRQSEGTKK